MTIKRLKIYSGYSESNPGGTQYLSAQVLNDYILDPVDGTLYKVESTGVGQIKPVKKKLGLVRGTISFLRSLGKSRTKKDKTIKNKN